MPAKPGQPPPKAPAEDDTTVLLVIDEEAVTGGKSNLPAHDEVRRRHWEMLAVSAIVVTLSLVLRLDDSGSVKAPIGDGWRMPPLCMSRAWFGIECPGCGLTRSLVCLAEGRFVESYGFHRVGWLMAFVIVLQGPYRVYELSRPARPVPERWKSWVGTTLLTALVANWLLKTFGY